LTEAKIDKEEDSRFRVSGDMTFATTRKLLADSKALFETTKNVNLNLADVDHADSAGLALLLEWIAVAKQMGGEISIEGMPESLLAIAKMCQMEDTLKSVSNKKKV
jgi:phospholipid transport system transporter-binding protein